MAPDRAPPRRGIRIGLKEQVIDAVVPDRAVGIIDPVALPGHMKTRPPSIRHEVRYKPAAGAHRHHRARLHGIHAVCVSCQRTSSRPPILRIFSDRPCGRGRSATGAPCRAERRFARSAVERREQANAKLEARYGGLVSPRRKRPKPAPRNNEPRSAPDRSWSARRSIRERVRSRLAGPCSQPCLHERRTWAPDQMSLWPVEGGRFGLDAHYEGSTGAQRAEYQAQKLAELNPGTTVHESASGRTTLRLGPLAHEAAWVASEASIGRPPPRAPGDEELPPPRYQVNGSSLRGEDTTVASLCAQSDSAPPRRSSLLGDGPASDHLLDSVLGAWDGRGHTGSSRRSDRCADGFLPCLLLSDALRSRPHQSRRDKLQRSLRTSRSRKRGSRSAHSPRRIRCARRAPSSTTSSAAAEHSGAAASSSARPISARFSPATMAAAPSRSSSILSSRLRPQRAADHPDHLPSLAELATTRGYVARAISVCSLRAALRKPSRKPSREDSGLGRTGGCALLITRRHRHAKVACRCASSLPL